MACSYLTEWRLGRSDETWLRWENPVRAIATTIAVVAAQQATVLIIWKGDGSFGANLTEGEKTGCRLGEGLKLCEAGFTPQKMASRICIALFMRSPNREC
jgi:hypothetical protein